jgi:hypothetical protein
MTSLFIIKDRRNSCNTACAIEAGRALRLEVSPGKRVNRNLNANFIDNCPRNAHIGLQLRRSRYVRATVGLMARGKRNG